MPQIVRTHQYVKKELSFLKKNPAYKERYFKTLELLAVNPRHKSLRLHKLKGKFANSFSVSINLQYRIILDFIIINDEALLIDIGTHDEVY